MKLSAVWITRNEEGVIGRSIDSVKAVADEMVVVDTGSTDDTVKVAEAHGARVMPFEWINDFAAARNYALSQVDGDAIVILDADEWFEPALTRADVAQMERALADKKSVCLRMQMTNVDLEKGVTIGVQNIVRVVRGHGAVRYVGAAHEHLVNTGGGALLAVLLKNLNINHTGYSASLTRDKMKRNAEIMEAALKAGVEEEDERTLLHLYLVREQNGLGNINRSLDHLQALMDNPAALREILQRYTDVGIQVSHLALAIASQRRSKVSRLQVDATVIKPAIKIYAETPAGATMRLYADLYLDYNEENILKELEPAITKGDALMEKTNTGREEYLRANAHLITAAGQAAWRRGRREKAFEYATLAMRQTEAAQYAETMALLLRTVKGLPLEDIAALLDSILNTQALGVQQAMLGAMRCEGYKDLYAHFSKKMLDAGRVKKTDLWYLMVLLGSCEQAAKSAWDARENTELADVQLAVFLAVICGGGKELYQNYHGQLGRYDPALALYYGMEANTADFELGVLSGTYHLIAFAAGRNVANNFIRAFGGVEKHMFRNQARYYMESGLYAELMAEALYTPTEQDAYELCVFAECGMMVGNYAEALGLLKAAMVYSSANFELFNLLGALAERAGEGEVAGEAAMLRDTYLPLYEKTIDWQDVVNTGYTTGGDSKKEKRELAQMTMKDLLNWVGPNKVQPMPGMVEDAYAAADAYEEKGMQYAAMEACRWLLVMDEDEGDIHRRMAGIFLQAGNAELAKQLT